MRTKRTHIVIPEQLVAQIDRVVGKRGRSSFLAQAAEKELMRLRQIKALKAATGAWRDGAHPELKHAAAAWVAELRREDERRYRRIGARYGEGGKV
jgi:metal-responsive CopG/Arc/MetJ family transcriptional regulator